MNYFQNKFTADKIATNSQKKGLQWNKNYTTIKIPTERFGSVLLTRERDDEKKSWAIL